MKISTLAFATLTSLWASPTSFLASATDPCANPPSTIDEDTDLFPVKADVKYSKQWSVSYHKTYKILTNMAAGTTYLLYCGSTPPSVDDVGNHTYSFSIPLERIVLGSTNQIPLVEQIGERTKIAGYYGTNMGDITSPCLTTMINDGQVTNLYHGEDTSHGGDGITDTHVDTFLTSYPNTPILRSYDSGDFGNVITVSEWGEKGNKATYEWLKMYGVLFNKEKEAEEVYDSFESRYDCLTDNAALIVADTEEGTLGDSSETDDTPDVLWAYYEPYYNQWAVSGCSGTSEDNYYCDFAKHCQSELVNPPDFSGDNILMDDDDFFNFAAGAEYWVYPGYDFDDKYKEHQSQMDTLPSVQNNKVYDVQGSGRYSWFEQRVVESDVVLEDFCQIVGHIDEITIPHQRKHLRKNLPVGEEPVGSLGPLGTCLIDDIEEPLTSRAGACFTYVGQTNNGGEANTYASLGMLLASMFTFFAI